MAGGALCCASDEHFYEAVITLRFYCIKSSIHGGGLQSQDSMLSADLLMVFAAFI